MSVLKLIYHCNVQSWTLARLSFNFSAEASKLETTKNIEVSKNFAFDDKSFVKPLIYINNRSGLKIGQWGTPPLTSAHEENLPFKTTFAFTLSKTFAISKKTPRTS